LRSKFSEQYLIFRNTCLTVPDYEDVRAKVKTLILERRTGYIVFTLPGEKRPYKIHIHISRKLNQLSLLGGHLVRAGDPRPGFQAAVKQELAGISKEEDDGH
jgi:hypothetical protein